MLYLTLTRAGVASVVQARCASPLWIGSDVLSDVEVQRLRATGVDVSVFVHPVRTIDEVGDAIATLAEHHPRGPIWTESLPETYNPRSSEFGQAFLWQEYIVGFGYRHNDLVAVVSGPQAGAQGCLVSLPSLVPEPIFTLEAESGPDIQVLQSSLVRSVA